MTINQPTLQDANPSKKIKHPTAQKNKILLPPTLLTFAFACRHTSQPKSKVKREQSPTLYKTR